jgi:hypothetical protein
MTVCWCVAFTRMLSLTVDAEFLIVPDVDNSTFENPLESRLSVRRSRCAHKESTDKGGTGRSLKDTLRARGQLLSVYAAY